MSQNNPPILYVGLDVAKLYEAWTFCARRNLPRSAGTFVSPPRTAATAKKDWSHNCCWRKSEIGNRKLFACGPTPLLKAVGKIAEDFNLPAELSMDEHMCCGVGVCLTCVIPVRTGDGWEYQRTCTEGPVFDSRQIVWEAVK